MNSLLWPTSHFHREYHILSFLLIFGGPILPLTLFKTGLFGAAHGWEDQKGPTFVKSVKHILQ